MRRQAKALSAGSTSGQGSRLGSVLGARLAAKGSRAPSLRLTTHASSSLPAQKNQIATAWSLRLAVPFALAVAAFLAFVPAAASATADANEPICPAETASSPGFRPYLPDCRAYELVSPPFKEGSPMSQVATSTDGSRIIAAGLGVLEGTESDNLGEFAGSPYELTRTGSGWVTSPLSPPASLFPESGAVDYSANLELSLWRLRSIAQPEGETDLYLRAPRAPGASCPLGTPTPSACFVHVGPLQPPSEPARFGEVYAYAGASQELSQVFIYKQPEQGLWPGDTTVEEKSLYEYAGVGVSEPKLVGVSNNGPLTSNEEADLISRCGVYLGATEGEDTYNAISASGTRVFFTARPCSEPGEPQVNELYARLNASETVKISEPSTGPTGNCETCNTSTPADATFQGASEEGTKLFFLTDQAELLPGAQGKNLYEYDFDGPPHEKLRRVSDEVSEPEVQGVTRVSEDGSRVYFVARGVLAANSNGQGGEFATARQGADNLYVSESGAGSSASPTTTAFIAALCSGEGESGTVADAQCHGSDEGLWSTEDGRLAEATPNGAFLAFTSFGNLTPGDKNPVAQVFEYDASSGGLVQVSVGQCPAPETTCEAAQRFNGGDTEDSEHYAVFGGPSYARSEGGSPTSRGSHLRISNDGTVFFTSNESLTPLARSGLKNVYEYRAGNVYLISDGQDTAMIEGESAVRLVGTDAFGQDVFFTTSDQLVGQDTDTQGDFYDARIDGGFLAPAPSLGCSGEACQGPLSATPVSPSAGSLTQAGGGNLPPKPKPLTRAQKLAKALKACREKPRSKRAACIRQAKKRYGAIARKHSHAKRSARRRK